MWQRTVGCWEQMKNRQGQDRELTAPLRDFGFCPVSSGKPLTDFKQRDDMTKFAFLRAPFDFHVENGLRHKFT